MNQRGQRRSARRWAYGIVIAAAVLAACGGDDDAGDADDGEPVATVAMTAADSGDSPSATGDGDELPFGDPCELVPADTVAGIVGSDVTSELVNMDDGLPGATCAYTVADGGTVSMSVSAMADTFYASYKSQAETNGGITPVDGLGDDAFVFGGSEVTARAGEAMIQLQLFTSGTTADTGGAEIVRAAVEAIGN